MLDINLTSKREDHRVAVRKVFSLYKATRNELIKPAFIWCNHGYLYLLDQQTRYIWKKLHRFITSTVSNFLQVAIKMMETGFY